jgi:hypothetical protein
MNEARYAFRIRQALNHGLNEVSPAAARRLEAARHLALARQKVPATHLALAGHRSSTETLWHGSPRLRQALAILALLTGIWFSFYLDSTRYVAELEAVDSSLLADDLPFEALLDKDFFEWLKDDTPEE